MSIFGLTARARNALHLARKPKMFAAVPERDVFLVSYPRSGNTWLRSMIAHLLIKRSIDSLRELDYVVPDVHYEVPVSRVPQLPFYVVKSHEPLRLETDYVKYRRVLHIVRDPRDVAMSYYRFRTNSGAQHVDLDGFVSDFVSGRIFPGSWHEHVESWTHEAEFGPGISIKTLRYEDIVNDTLSALKEIAEFLQIGTDKCFLQQIVDGSSLERMRKKELNGNRPNYEKGYAYVIGDGQVAGFKARLDAENAAKIIRMAEKTMRKYRYI